MNPLRSLIEEVQFLIRQVEENYADLVLNDFDDGLSARSDAHAQVKYCVRWLRMYQCE